MYRVAFLGYESDYQGGINYFNNLFFSVNSLTNPKIKIIAFVGKKSNYQYNLYSNHVSVVKTSVLDRFSFLWLVNRVGYRLFGYPIIINFYMKKYNIDVLSHSFYHHRLLRYKTLNWIPDFQPLIYSHLWKEKEIKTWKQVFYKHIKESDGVVLSSNDALKDYTKFAPLYVKKARVLHFVSQPSVSLNVVHNKNIREKYNVKGKFFFLPNQFWKHKNHLVVFEAVKILKKTTNIIVVCSGLLKDFRNNDNSHVEGLLNFIKVNNLKENIKILGMIDYDEVLWFMKNSIAVINPSLFEGWSSTVEESKSMGKQVVLSDINVHKEQNPKNGIFFYADSPLELSFILEDLISSGGNVFDMIEVKKDLENRVIEFGIGYQNIIIELLGKSR
jgi:hypothetical protein